jgi:O-antigen/teichoic acid export membrane protein
VINVINFAMAWVDVLLLSSFTDASTVGVYAVASRCAALVTLVLMSVNAVVPPMFAERHAVGDTGGLAEVARASARLCLAGSIGLGLGLFFWGRGILGLFGEGIADRGFSVLAVLVLGRIVGSAAGSAGFLLMMSGRQQVLSVCAGITLVVGVSLGVLLIPRYGLIGAASATTAMTVTYNVLAVAMARNGLGFWSISDRLALNVALGIATIGVFFAARLLLPVTVAGAIALAPYAVAAFLLTRDAGASLRRPHV